MHDALNSSNETLLEVHNLKTYFFTVDGVLKAVDGVSFTIRQGEILGLVGESGCGKSVTSLSIMRLVGYPGRLVNGLIRFKDIDLLNLSEHEMVHFRGNHLSMIFQQPLSSLNPVFKVGRLVAESLLIHRDIGKQAAWQKAIELLQMVGIPDAEHRVHAYPHEFSGGMAQRVMIAIAIACEPELLIADEPTTALDVTIQAQILNLLRALRSKTGMAIFLITHDLGVIAEMADRVAVMYAGQIVEENDVQSLFTTPLHPYTQGLIASTPVLGRVKDRLEVIPGNVPNCLNLPPGCNFAPRCRARGEYNLAICTEVAPQLETRGIYHKVRCWLYNASPEHTHKPLLLCK